VDAANNLYRIALVNYTDKYLTAGGNSDNSNVYWTGYSATNDAQVWKITATNPNGGTVTPPPPPPPSGSFTYPTTPRGVSGGFSSSHKGIDIPGNNSNAIYAFADGQVAFTQDKPHKWHPDNDNNTTNVDGSMDSMGHCIAINHNNPDANKATGAYARTIYMHMNAASTRALGSTVKKGDVIGYIGDTGRRTGAHLHFALAVGSNADMKPGKTGWISISSLPIINPTTYLPDYK
jgi:murein DD-endopeptidase MepM/ murein hydrolase activator NlpD